MARSGGFYRSQKLARLLVARGRELGWRVGFMMLISNIYLNSIDSLRNSIMLFFPWMYWTHSYSKWHITGCRVRYRIRSPQCLQTANEMTDIADSPEGTLCERIRETRQNMGLTQEEFAAKLGVTFSTVNRWENGKSKPSRMALKILKPMLEPASDSP